MAKKRKALTFKCYQFEYRTWSGSGSEVRYFTDVKAARNYFLKWYHDAKEWDLFVLCNDGKFYA